MTATADKIAEILAEEYGVIASGRHVAERIVAELGLDGGGALFAHNLAAVVENVMGPVVDAVVGHRAKLAEQGFSQEACEAGALQFHAAMMQIVTAGAVPR